MSWKIISQEENVGKNKRFVDCRHVRFFPIKQANEVKFGKIGFPVLKVVIQNDDGVSHYITWSNKTEKLSTQNPGKFVYHFPDKKEYRKITLGNGRVIDDKLSPMIEKKGETMDYDCHELFWKWLSERRGNELCEQVKAAFAKRLVEFVGAA